MTRKANKKKNVIGVVAERCPQNHICPVVKKCPEGAVIQEGFKAPTIDQEKCVGCMVCVKICPNKAFVKMDV